MHESMTRRGFMRHAGAVAAVSVAATAATGRAQESAGKRRNIVFILTDDQRFDALGYLNSFYETPALDALASGGILFENAFVTTALCSPSRATILSSQYVHRHGVLDNNTLLPEETPTFPKELQRAGYETAYIGKWHMGGSTDAPQPGFNHWVSFKGQGVYNGPALNVDGESVKREGYITDLLTDYAEAFIRKERQTPFFLFLGHKAVHANFESAARHKGTYADRTYTRPASMADTEENYRGKPAWVRTQRNSWHGVDGMYDRSVNYDQFIRDYAETLRAVDDSVGRIVQALRDTGQLESTLLVFTSDNGFMFGEHGLIDKRAMYEPSIRVPLLVHCPELFTGGQRRDEMIVNLDYAPTFLEAAGLEIPSSMQGQSFYGLLDGSRQDRRDAWLYEYFWERSFPQTPTVLGVRTDRYKFMQYHGIWDRYELYDLKNDPGEMNNLLGEFMIGTEAGQLDAHIQRQAKGELREVYTNMRRLLDRLIEETGCEPEPNWMRRR